jgi:hypothetical protein
VREPQDGYAFQTEKFCCFNATVAGNNLVRVIDQNRIAESEARDAIGDLPYLFAGMCAGVRFVGDQVLDWCRFDMAVGLVEEAAQLRA